LFQCDDEADNTQTLDSNVATTSAGKQSWPCPLFYTSDSETSTAEDETSEPDDSDHSDGKISVVQN
jgi:hypothetical protein